MVFKVKPKAATQAALIKDGTYRAVVSNLKQFANTYGERIGFEFTIQGGQFDGERVMRSTCLLYTSPSPRDRTRSRMPSSA